MNISYVLDVQPDLSYAHPQRTEAIHLHHVSKGILPQFRSQEGNIAFIIQVRKDDGLVMMKYIDKETITGIKEFMKHRFDRKYIFCYLFIAWALSMT